jgi:GH24 family phage-related lysozyme (muramidase)
MRIPKAALDLIKKYEGLRLNAYKCSAGVWTIGYGHTSAAGEPEVTPGMTITRAEANRIFDKDIQNFAVGVERLIKVPVSPAQFGACVSLAFNIGLGAFKKSSVLRFINQNRMNDAADAFLLWNKAGGKVLKGLVRRRAEEAELFSSADKADVRVPDEPKGKSMALSTTNIAAGATAAAGVTAATKEIVDNTSSILSGSGMMTVILAVIVIAGAAWIIRERWAKARDWAV